MLKLSPHDTQETPITLEELKNEYKKRNGGTIC